MRVEAGPFSTALTGIVLKISARGSIFDPRFEYTFVFGSKNGDFGGFRQFFGHNSTCRARYWFKLGLECM